MRVALIGDGAMGQLVSMRARDEKHDIGAIISSAHAELGPGELADALKGHDVAIDFSVAGAVLRNIEAACLASVPLVEGTTGWGDQTERVRQVVGQHNGSLVYGANFSVGVNIFYRIVARASELFSAVDGYAPFIEEAHHSRKRDAPSGTALRLRNTMTENLKCDIPVASTRAGHIPGTHRVGFDGLADQIMLSHTARSRAGFAAGALVAARWIQGKRGVFEFSEIFDEIS